MTLQNRRLVRIEVEESGPRGECGFADFNRAADRWLRSRGQIANRPFVYGSRETKPKGIEK